MTYLLIPNPVSVRHCLVQVVMSGEKDQRIQAGMQRLVSCQMYGDKEILDSTDIRCITAYVI